MSEARVSDLGLPAEWHAGMVRMPAETGPTLTEIYDRLQPVRRREHRPERRRPR